MKANDGNNIIEYNRAKQDGSLAAVAAVATGSKSGNPTCDNEGIEPWIVNAARDLANDAMHIPTIARIIKRHVPTSNDVVRDGPQTGRFL